MGVVAMQIQSLLTPALEGAKWLSSGIAALAEGTDPERVWTRRLRKKC
jgi:hypothetical protein